MRADRGASSDVSTPDGAQMLLLAGFVISATAIVAIGAYTALQSGDTQGTTQSNRPLLDLFLNTRERAVDFFELVSEFDTAASVEDNLDGYLFSQYQTARSMSVQLNASLAGEDKIAPKSEEVHFTDGSNNYEWLTGEQLWSKAGNECYSGLSFDGTNDGLVTDSDGTVVGAIFWLEVEGVDTELEEYIVIDVPSTSVDASCGAWKGSWTDNSPSGVSETLRDVGNTSNVPIAVGDNGRIFQRSAGGSWTEVDSDGPSGNGNNLRGMDVTDNGDHVWVVGASGEVGEYDASDGSLVTDHSQPDGSSNQFNDVAVTGDANSATIYIADSSGQIHRSTDDGSSWNTTTPGGGNEIHAIDFYTTNKGVAVDNNGHVLETTDGGDTWTDTDVTSSTLHGVDGVNENDIWASAAGGDVLHWDGDSWTQTTVDSNGNNLFSIEMSQGEGHVVGQSGKIFHWDGASWSEETSGTSEALHGTSIDDRAIAVGTNGAIVET